MPIPEALDQQIRTAAFIQVRRMLELRDPLTSEDLARGFVFQGERIPLINPQRGIFKPTAMKYALSIKTVVPRKGARTSVASESRTFHLARCSSDYGGFSALTFSATARHPVMRPSTNRSSMSKSPSYSPTLRMSWHLERTRHTSGPSPSVCGRTWNTM